MELKDRLKAEIERSHYTQASLGKAAGVSQVAIQKILSGDTRNPRNIVEIANALRVNVTWLKTGKGERSASSEPLAGLSLASDNPEPYTPALDQEGVAWVIEFMDENITEDVKKVRDLSWRARIFAILYDAYMADRSVATLDSNLVKRLVQI